jgi:transcriptional regulator with XRE-family HTH domain
LLSFSRIKGNNPHKREDFLMKISIEKASAIGDVVRAARKTQGIRQDDAAGSIGVSENFLGKIERGGESMQWGKLFQVLEGLGIHVTLDVPDEVSTLLKTESAQRDQS